MCHAPPAADLSALTSASSPSSALYLCSESYCLAMLRSLLRPSSLRRCGQHVIAGHVQRFRAVSGARWYSSSSAPAPEIVLPSLVESLFRKCDSCGIKLQTDDSAKPGFYSQPDPNKPAFVKNEDVTFDRYHTDLSEEDKKLLLNGATDVSPTAHKRPKDDHKHDKLVCVRCRGALFRSNFPPERMKEEYPMQSVEDILSGIPPTGNIVYIVSAQDFPMSLNDAVFKFRPALEVKFVVTKNDLLFKKSTIMNKLGLTFFRDYLNVRHGVSPANVQVASGLVDWNTDKLADFFGNNSYLVGSVNSGKSTLIQSILYSAEKKREKSKHVDSKTKRHLEKTQNSLINAPTRALRRSQEVRLHKEAVSRFKKTHGPGASFMPGFTRGHIQYELLGKYSATIFDTPGFVSSNLTNYSYGIYDLVHPKQLRHVLKGGKFHDKGDYTARYDTLKPNQALTIGGIVYVVVPDKTMFQYRNCINWEPHVFSGFERATSVASTLESNPAMQKTYLVDPKKTKVRKYIVPSFYGAVDLVIRNLGHINLKPTGAKQTDSSEPLVVYLPEGVEAIIRQPIEKYITRTLSGRDSHGNPLRKEHWVSKSTTHLKRYSGNSPFFSRLIPVRPEEENESANEVMKRYVSGVKGSAVNDVDVREENKYANWISY